MKIQDNFYLIFVTTLQERYKKGYTKNTCIKEISNIMQSREDAKQFYEDVLKAIDSVFEQRRDAMRRGDGIHLPDKSLLCNKQ